MDKRNIHKEFFAALEAKDWNKILETLEKSVIHEQDLIMNNSANVLGTAGYSAYVKACVEAGCSVDYVNLKLNMLAINYAVESLDYHNISELQTWAKGMVNLDYKYEGETALTTICKRLCPDNIDHCRKCVYNLIELGASPNITDREGQTPMFYVLQSDEIPISERSRFVCILLKSPHLNKEDYDMGYNFVLQNDPVTLICYKYHLDTDEI